MQLKHNNRFLQTPPETLTVSVEINESDCGQRVMPIGELTSGDGDGGGRGFDEPVVEYDALTNNRGDGSEPDGLKQGPKTQADRAVVLVDVFSL